MRYILARANRELLDAFACSNMLLALDFDGTLAPIVSDPARASLRATTRLLLQKASRHRPCVVISGRARSDVRRRLRGTGVADVIGNHGLEPSGVTASARRVVRRWLPHLRQRLGDVRGIAIEDKGLSIAVHYRNTRQRAAARTRIVGAAAEMDGVRLVGGKLVVNLLPAGAPHKGLALEAARERFACDTALYVGDDETDEDVFALDQPGRLLAIRVGRRRGSAAGYYIRNQREIDRVLRALSASLATASGTRGGGEARARG
jgi:trehalose 6-phosphate phosphatase